MDWKQPCGFERRVAKVGGTLRLGAQRPEHERDSAERLEEETRRLQERLVVEQRRGFLVALVRKSRHKRAMNQANLES